MNSVETPVRAFEFQTPWDKTALRERRAGDISTVSIPTNIYHVSYTPEAKEVSLFFWGCNFSCRECLCKKNVYNYLITENLGLFDTEPTCVVNLPTRFLNLDELTDVLDGLDVSTVLLEGQEASLDPAYLPITEMLHKRYGTRNVLCTNAYRLPPLEHTDDVQISLKAFNDELHRHYTGKSNTRVFENVINLYKSGKKISLASLLIPDYITASEIERLAEFVGGVDKNIPFHILAFFKAYSSQWRRPAPGEMEEAGVLARRHLNRVWAWTGKEKMTCEVLRIV